MNCSLCGRKAQDWFISDLPGYWYCKNCDLAWIKKIPKVEYNQSYYKGKSGIISKLFTPIAFIFYSLRISYINNKSEINTYIDVGAGAGEFLKRVRAKRRIGVEVSKVGRDAMQNGGLETMTDEDFLSSRGLKADVISFWHVLEHVENPLAYLKAAKANLDKKGKIIIGVPNIDSFEFNFAKRYWFHLQLQFHLWHFSTKSLKRHLQKTGFKIEKIDYWSLEHHLTGVLQSFINKMAGSQANVLHKLIKRDTGRSKIKYKDFFWSLFFLTVGAPIILFFWILGAVSRKSGTIVVAASRKT